MLARLVMHALKAVCNRIFHVYCVVCACYANVCASGHAYSHPVLFLLFPSSHSRTHRHTTTHTHLFCYISKTKAYTSSHGKVLRTCQDYVVDADQFVGLIKTLSIYTMHLCIHGPKFYAPVRTTSLTRISPLVSAGPPGIICTHACMGHVSARAHTITQVRRHG